MHAVAAGDNGASAVEIGTPDLPASPDRRGGKSYHHDKPSQRGGHGDVIHLPDRTVYIYLDRTVHACEQDGLHEGTLALGTTESGAD
jgi:hypothetical protein